MPWCPVPSASYLQHAANTRTRWLSLTLTHAHSLTHITALALHRVGIPVRLVEVSDVAGPAALFLPSNAVAVLNELGLANALSTQGSRPM